MTGPWDDYRDDDYDAGYDGFDAYGRPLQPMGPGAYGAAARQPTRPRLDRQVGADGYRFSPVIRNPETTRVRTFNPPAELDDYRDRAQARAEALRRRNEAVMTGRPPVPYHRPLLYRAGPVPYQNRPGMPAHLPIVPPPVPPLQGVQDHEYGPDFPDWSITPAGAVRRPPRRPR